MKKILLFIMFTLVSLLAYPLGRNTGAGLVSSKDYVPGEYMDCSGAREFYMMVVSHPEIGSSSNIFAASPARWMLDSLQHPLYRFQYTNLSATDTARFTVTLRCLDGILSDSYAARPFPETVPMVVAPGETKIVEHTSFKVLSGLLMSICIKPNNNNIRFRLDITDRDITDEEANTISAGFGKQWFFVDTQPVDTMTESKVAINLDITNTSSERVQLSATLSATLNKTDKQMADVNLPKTYNYDIAPGETIHEHKEFATVMARGMWAWVDLDVKTPGAAVSFKSDISEIHPAPEDTVIVTDCSRAPIFSWADGAVQMPDTIQWYNVAVDTLRPDSMELKDIMLYLENMSNDSLHLEMELWTSCSRRDSLTATTGGLAGGETKQRRVGRNLLKQMDFSDLFVRLKNDAAMLRFRAELVDALPAEVFYADTVQVSLCENVRYYYGDSLQLFYDGPEDSLLVYRRQFLLTTASGVAYADSVFSFDVHYLHSPELPTSYRNLPTAACGKAIVIPGQLSQEINSFIEAQPYRSSIASIRWEQGWWSDAKQEYTDWRALDRNELQPLWQDSVALRYIIETTCDSTLTSDPIVVPTTGRCLEVELYINDTVCYGDDYMGLPVTEPRYWNDTVLFVSADGKQRGDTLRHYAVRPYETRAPQSLRTLPTLRAGRRPSLDNATRAILSQIQNQSPAAAPLTYVWTGYDAAQGAWVEADSILTATTTDTLSLRLELTTLCEDTFIYNALVQASAPTREVARITLSDCADTAFVEQWSDTILNLYSDKGDYRFDSIYSYTRNVYANQYSVVRDTLTFTEWAQLQSELHLTDTITIDSLLTEEGCSNIVVHYYTLVDDTALPTVGAAARSARLVWVNGRVFVLRDDERYTVTGQRL